MGNRIRIDNTEFKYIQCIMNKLCDERNVLTQSPKAHRVRYSVGCGRSERGDGGICV